MSRPGLDADVRILDQITRDNLGELRMVWLVTSVIRQLYHRIST